MDDRRRERRERIAEAVDQRKYSGAVDDVAGELSELLGSPVGSGDAVAKEAVREAIDSARKQDEFHLIWHRVWGVRLLSEVIETMNRMADLLDDEEALVVWGRPKVGFLLPVAQALRSLPAHVGPDADQVGPGGRSDLLVIADQGEAGLRLEYNHLAYADEYELRTWGRYAKPST